MNEPALIPELNCSNLETSLNFYIDILGFKILYDRPESFFAMIERQGAWLMLEQVDIRNRLWLKGVLEKPYGRGINFQIQTTDVNSLYAKVSQNNCDVFLPMEERWYRADDLELGNKQFIVCDPDGYLLRFFEDIGERPNQKTLD